MCGVIKKVKLKGRIVPEFQTSGFVAGFTAQESLPKK
jgi:hypothetical protein